MAFLAHPLLIVACEIFCALQVAGIERPKGAKQTTATNQGRLGLRPITEVSTCHFDSEQTLRRSMQAGI